MLAPGYAAAIAFGAVALSSLVVAPRESDPGPAVKVTVTVSAADARLLTGLTVQVRDGATVLAAGSTDAKGTWSADVAPGDHEVCVVSAAGPVRLAGSKPPSACGRESLSADKATELDVERVQVIAQRTGGGDQVPSGGKVTIRYAEGTPKSGVLDETGRFTPSELPLNAEVCLDLPTGWQFVDSKADAEKDGQQCQAVTNPAADVLFRVEAS
ncbi:MULTISPECIES: hypothetical protein [unclassified Pseudofrankia]|uniref:hypothetical protein n=1 Tax=unclassified Pseudofrankia TaxID=2994372 RepID=UPI001F517868|nr:MULTISPECIES: hypothetical protein [unclassified Pseudofrankia]MDT3446176.1 hypothetical protein [Pseudofrankia sp. BMG5.37]